MSTRRATGRNRRFAGGRPLLAQYAASLGVTLDYDADGVYINSGAPADGAAISTWNGRGTAGVLALTQGTGANQPLWKASATPNGRPSVNLDTTAKTLSRGTGLGVPSCANAAETMFLVVKRASGSGRIVQHANNAGSQGQRLEVVTSNRASVFNGAGVSSDGATTANWEVWATRCAASGGYGTALTTNEFYVNGSLVSTSGGTNMTQGIDVLFVGVNGVTCLSEVARWMHAPSIMMSAADTIALSQALVAFYGVT